ncbi:bolA domain protein [Rhodotorula toruloides]|uniref:BolA domain protein n=1 Tax=Rhodotorula toruloides TaxID=5286 RepID=A0A511KIQ6_RHOTO|nr:bolA domain protein [Rhodotorula toruloides]
MGDMLARTLLRTHRAALVARPQPLRPLAVPSFPRFISSTAPLRDSATDGEETLRKKLTEALEGAKIEVQDVSVPHTAPCVLVALPPLLVGGCGTFYAISVEHESFKGLSMIKQHRIVNELLKDNIKGMHGLQLKTKAP